MSLRWPHTSACTLNNEWLWKWNVRYLPIQDTEPFSDILRIQTTTLDQVLLQHPRKQAHVSIGNRSKQRSWASYTAVLMNKFKNTSRSEKQRGFWKEMYTYIENTWRTHEQIISNYISIVRKNTLVLWHSFNYESQFKAALGLAGKYCVWKLKKKTPMIYTFWANSLFFPVKFALFCKFYIFSVNFTLFSVESVLFSIKFTHCPYKISSPKMIITMKK